MESEGRMSLWNGKPMADGVGNCAMLPAGPMRRSRVVSSNKPLTREQMVRLGCVFPVKSASRPITDADYRNREGGHNPRREITAQERATAVAMYGSGKTAVEIGFAMKRWPVVIRKILREAGIDLQARAVVSKRSKALAMLAAGERPCDVAWKLDMPLATAVTYRSEVRRTAA